MQRLFVLSLTQRFFLGFQANVLYLHKCYNDVESHASEDELSSWPRVRRSAMQAIEIVSQWLFCTFSVCEYNEA